MSARADVKYVGPLMIAVLVLAVHMATNGRYGYFRDELYFIACGRRLAFGYVDQPPLIAIVSRISELLSAGSVMWFRLPAALAHCALIFLAGRTAVYFGSTALGATLAALAVAVSPTFLVSGHLLTMNAFEPLFWLGAAVCVALLIEGADPKREQRLWIALGAIVGLGVLNKHSMIFYTAALCAGWIVSPERRAIRLKGLMLAVGVAALIILPHAIWQASNGFPMLELLENGRKYKNTEVTAAAFTFGQFFEQNPVNGIVWLAGLWFLARSKYRALAIAHALLFLVFLKMGAKVYYFAPTYPLLYAAGGALLGKWRWPSRGLGVGMTAVGTLGAMLTIPVLPPERVVELQRKLGVTPPRMEKMRYSELPQHLADEFGWEEMVAAVARAHDTLSAEEKSRAVIFGDNYGEAGALEFFGPARGLPKIYAGHNNYYLWGPPPESKNIVITMGVDREELEPLCTDLREEAKTPASIFAMPYESEHPIFVCRGMKQTWAQIWPETKAYR